MLCNALFIKRFLIFFSVLIKDLWKPLTLLLVLAGMEVMVCHITYTYNVYMYTTHVNKVDCFLQINITASLTFGNVCTCTIYREHLRKLHSIVMELLLSSFVVWYT